MHETGIHEFQVPPFCNCPYSCKWQLVDLEDRMLRSSGASGFKEVLEPVVDSGMEMELCFM